MQSRNQKYLSDFGFAKGAGFIRASVRSLALQRSVSVIRARHGETAREMTW
jgi:hypothetical protein